MPKSAARKRFQNSQKDVNQLSALHQRLKPGPGPGAPKVGASALNRASIVFICSLWEAYCEDLAEEAVAHITSALTDPSVLSDGTKHSLATSCVEPWDLAGDAWQLKLAEHVKSKVEKLNTPKTENIDNLFSTGAGLSGVSKGWKWQNSTPAKARKKLDELVSLRGALAHGQEETAVLKSDVTDALALVEHLVSATDPEVNRQVDTLAGTPLF